MDVMLSRTHLATAITVRHGHAGDLGEFFLKIFDFSEVTPNRFLSLLELNFDTF